MTTTDVPARGPTRNAGLPPREGDPWTGNPVIRKLMRQAELPERHAIILSRYIQLSALIEWGAIGYEAGSLEETARELQALPIHSSLGVNLHILAALLQSSEDLLIRMLQGPENRQILLAGVDGLMDTDRIEMNVITPLVHSVMRTSPMAELPVRIPNGELYAWLQEHGLAAISMHTIMTIGDAVANMLQGDLLILVDGFPHGLFASFRGWAERGISESTTEPGMRAPKESFNESIRTMTALVRRRMRSPHLRIERYLIGVQSPTAVDLLYLQGITSPDLIHEARARLQRIQVDRLKTAGMLEELLEDQPSAFFPQFLTTERPDRVSSYLMEGKIAFLIDGEQNAKLAPVSFVHFLSAPDDYEERFWWASFIVLIRLLFQVMVIIIPSLYVSVMSMHPDLLPTRILVSLAAARLEIPYPTIIEVLILELFFEGMREATALMPRTIGSAVTVVGGLVIGEGAISAGLASPATVVVVALTGIASFTIPGYSLTIGLRMLRFGLLLLSASFGLYGLMAGMLFIALHMASLRSFGRPYLQPLAPFNFYEALDAVVRPPFWFMRKRPKGNRTLNWRRSGDWLRPNPRQ